MAAPACISIRRSAAKLIISRSRSASALFYTSARRFIMSSVIGGPSKQELVSQPDIPESTDDHRATTYTTPRDVTPNAGWHESS